MNICNTITAHIIECMFVGKKKTIANIFGAGLKGNTLNLVFNGEKLVIYFMEGNEIHILYAARVGLNDFIKNMKTDERPIPPLKYMEIDIHKASTLVKNTWSKRVLPMRFEPFFFSFFSIIALAGFLEMLFAIWLFIREILLK